MNFNEYENFINELSETIKNNKLDKESFEFIEKYNVISEKLEKNIEQLIEKHIKNELKPLVPNFDKECFKRILYYEITEYCFKKIRQDDKALQCGFGMTMK